jgi:hypothetical protein
MLSSHIPVYRVNYRGGGGVMGSSQNWGGAGSGPDFEVRGLGAPMPRIYE